MRAGFIIDNGDGTIRVEIEKSWNTPDNKPNQLAKYDLDNDDYPKPPDGVPEKYWAWNGSEIIEASQTVKDAVDNAAHSQAVGYINAIMEEPIWRVMKKIIYLLAGKLGFTKDQINQQIATWINEEVNA